MGFKELANYHQPKKKFGQNFFTNKALLTKIVELVATSNANKVIEIGPGLGAFSQGFIDKGLKLKLIEIDHELIESLTHKFPGIEIIEGDFLEINLDQLFTPADQDKVVVFGALPYNISKKIIRRLVEYDRFETAYFIIQKEVAGKYLDRAPQSNILSLATQLYANVEKVMDLNPSNFSPKPKVTSSLIKVTKIEYPGLDKVKKAQVTELIKHAFGMPRKTLANNLKGYVQGIENHLLGKKRPQELTIDDFIELAKFANR